MLYLIIYSRWSVFNDDSVYDKLNLQGMNTFFLIKYFHLEIPKSFPADTIRLVQVFFSSQNWECYSWQNAEWVQVFNSCIQRTRKHKSTPLVSLFISCNNKQLNFNSTHKSPFETLSRIATDDVWLHFVRLSKEMCGSLDLLLFAAKLAWKISRWGAQIVEIV